MFEKIRFFLALWAGKFFIILYNLKGKNNSDRPGMAALRICPDFIKLVNKPELRICVTGTNGKTSISSMIRDILRRDGKTVAKNFGGANHHSGVTYNLLNGVNIFNQVKCDAVVIEIDELISKIDLPLIKPQFVIVNNIARDSMFRNANPNYVFENLKVAVDSVPDATLILNAHDPLSCNLSKDRKCIYFGVNDCSTPESINIIDSVHICPECGSKLNFSYRNYRQFGEFSCDKCDFKSPQCDYFATDCDIENNVFTVREPNGSSCTYPVPSNYMFHFYNICVLISLFREIGISQERLCHLLNGLELPVSRATQVKAGDIDILCIDSKGQNVTATSSVFEAVSKDNGTKEIIIIPDEIYETEYESEPIAWIWDTDYEFLNSPSIKKIIIGGERWLDHKVRLLMAGIPETKITCIKNIYETPQYVSTSGIDKIYILYDGVSDAIGRELRDTVQQLVLKAQKDK